MRREHACAPADRDIVELLHEIVDGNRTQAQDMLHIRPNIIEVGVPVEALAEELVKTFWAPSVDEMFRLIGPEEVDDLIEVRGGGQRKDMENAVQGTDGEEVHHLSQRQFLRRLVMHNGYTL